MEGWKIPSVGEVMDIFFFFYYYFFITFSITNARNFKYNTIKKKKKKKRKGQNKYE